MSEATEFPPLDGTLPNSWGNGPAMRVAPVGLAFGSVERVLHEAERSIAEAFYGSVPAAIRDPVVERLPRKFIDVIDAFRHAYRPAAGRGPPQVGGSSREMS